MRYATPSLTCLALNAAVVSAAFAANEFCVTNDAQLEQALLNAENLPARIKVVQGSYHLDATKWHLHNPYFDPHDSRIVDGSSLLGGYSDADCSARDVAAGNTVFTDDSAGSAGSGTVFLGDLLIEGITFRLKQGLALRDDIYPDDGYKTNPQPEVTIRRSVFENTLGSVALYVDTTDTTIILENSLIKANPTDGSSCTVFFYDTNGSNTVQAINNTLVNNNEEGLCIANRTPHSHSKVYVYNNILYDDNGTDDLYTDSDNAIIVDNIIGHRSSAVALNTPPVGTINADPQLTGTYRPTEPTSPAINSGSNYVPGGLPSTDLDGGPRLIGSAVDRGAYESLTDDATVLTVTNTADSGAGSLREAIINANANPGNNSIHFAIGSGCGPHVITLASGLPLVSSNLSIKGYTQPGASANDLDIGDDATICVVLQAATSSVQHALHVGATSSATLSVSGVAFSGFADSAIYLNGGSDHSVTGVHMGGSVGGVDLDPVERGVEIGPGVSGVTVGGSDDSARNIIGQSGSSAIYVAGPSSPLLAAHDNQIINNYVGIGWNRSSGQFTNRGNANNGIYVAGDHNLVSSNEIGANGADGVRIDGSPAVNNWVLFNDIGTIYANQGNGVAITGDGANNLVAANTIMQNAGAGIRIPSGQGNELLGNSISGNGALGIDLAAAGVTPNDDDSVAQPADYANRGLNFPLLTAASGGHVSGSVSGTLTTTPGDYMIEVFGNSSCDASGYGQGDNYAGDTTVSIPAAPPSGQGTAAFALPVALSASLTGQTYFTAVAIDSAGNTSEFSACQLYVDDTIFADGFE